MLLDTGADISLIAHDRLSVRLAGTIQPSQRRNPRAAAGHEVEVIGTLRMTVRAGGLVINNHPFPIVLNLIVPLIGGVDLIVSGLCWSSPTNLGLREQNTIGLRSQVASREHAS